MRSLASSFDIVSFDIVSDVQLQDVLGVLVRLVESAGAIVIFSGAAVAFVRFLVVALRSRMAADFVPVRLGLGRSLALGLEFQLAGDVLRTAVAPTFRELGQLGAVAAIRTALNFFLARENDEERRQVSGEGPARPGSGAGDRPPPGAGAPGRAGPPA